MENNTEFNTSGLGHGGYGGYGNFGGIAPVGLFGITDSFGHGHRHGHSDCDDLKDYIQNQKTHETVIDVAREVIENRHETEKAISHLGFNFKDNLCDVKNEIKETKYDLSRQIADGFCEVKEREYERELRRKDERIDELTSIAHGNFPLTQQAQLVKVDPCQGNNNDDIMNIIIGQGNQINQLANAVQSLVSNTPS